MVCKVAPSDGTPTHRTVGSDSQDQAQGVADYETALDLAGYGRFSRSVLGACACAFFTTGVQNCVMSYVLPAAKCELNLTTYQAGLVNMAFMCGGVASAFFWGIVADVFGRRTILSATLLIDSVILLAQSTVSDYRILLAARTVNGFLIGGPSTIVFTYLSDLVGMKRRQLYLNITGMSFVAAWLILPAVAWLVIPFKLESHSQLPIHSWRLYLALGSIPGFLAGMWVLLLPESPRLLCDTNRSEMALKLLTKIHRCNMGFAGEFKVKKLIPDNIFVAKSVNGEENRTKILFIGVLKDLKMFVSKTYALKSTLILFVFFANMAAGFGLNLWIPELLLRMQGKECAYARSIPETAKLFNASNVAWKELSKVHDDSLEIDKFNGTLFNAHEAVGSSVRCDGNIDSAVFTSGLIVGVCCVLGNAACAVLSGRGGARGVQRAAAACALACALACACLAACACSCATSSKVAVAAAAALNAASLNGNVLLIRLLLHALPAKLSGLGVCWGAWWGRAGGVVSNLAVGVLLDYSCPAPFVSVAGLLTISIGAIMMIKLDEQNNNETVEEKTEPENEKYTGLDRYISTHM
ncbi:PREDICTED: synaptic vesicle glycoprotein 2B-like [Papilio xuthus]|uniref:Synaptic vesicle glycoprotein 2B-like n=1 Tax=Papilio xuthus TaxID=66420 RepID=A0AAJ6Z9V5_PAPXU|nr:PREDICTED: synaptic vesicle glycoprotein 2B-like [Papilio xuthus]